MKLVLSAIFAAVDWRAGLLDISTEGAMLALANADSVELAMFSDADRTSELDGESVV